MHIQRPLRPPAPSHPGPASYSIVMVPFSLSQLIRISSSSRPFITSGDVTAVKRTWRKCGAHGMGVA